MAVWDDIIKIIGLQWGVQGHCVMHSMQQGEGERKALRSGDQG